MKNILYILFAGFLIFTYQNAYAQGECEKYTSSYDQTYCYVKLFVESDKELNSVYKELRGYLKKTTKNKLTEVQRAWMKYRDHACQPDPGTIAVNCNYEINRERTEYLRDRLRECKTGTCRGDMIGSKSWD